MSLIGTLNRLVEPNHYYTILVQRWKITITEIQWGVFNSEDVLNSEGRYTPLFCAV